VPFRLEVRIDCNDVGRRVTVRRRLADGRYSDVIGILEACDDETFGVRDRDGELRVLPRTDVVAAKRVEPRA
jgi:hypothetical protein